MLVKVYAGATYGIKATIITIEVNIRPGVGFTIVGLPDSAVKESIQRIETAIRNCGFEMPHMNITVNMAPADIKKEGSAYDLPIAIGILCASGQANPEKLEKLLVIGELSLDGTIRSIKGTLPISMHAQKEGFRGFILPPENAREAAVVQDFSVYAPPDLPSLVKFLNGVENLPPVSINLEEYFAQHRDQYDVDFADVKGQQYVKRALEIAAAGGHNVLMIGPPGAGKTMIARRIPTILPPLTLAEALETTMIYSVAGKVPTSGLITTRPFRAPHHTISEVALVGGGQIPRPGEISLAHNGVLFLDELPEFPRSVLEVLRQPLEDRVVTISRAKYSVEYPASFTLVASMNPCPCGYLNHPTRKCTCTTGEIKRYLQKISGPLLDRIDIHIEVSPVPVEDLQDREEGESSSSIRARVIRARQIQQRRFAGFDGIHCNAAMPSRLMEEFCRIDGKGREVLRMAMERLSMSARAYSKILKVARTIADLDDSPTIELPHLTEAIQYRTLDREHWLAQ